MRRFTPPLDIPKMPKVDDWTDIAESGNNPKVKKYTEKYVLSEQDASKKVADEKANKVRLKFRKFSLKLGDAAIGAIVMLFFEHIIDIVRFVRHVISLLTK